MAEPNKQIGGGEQPMSPFQKRAIDAARLVLAQSHNVAQISASDSALLRLAVTQNPQGPLYEVARRVLEDAEQRRGFFAGIWA
jgi:hypothetical protein